VSPLTAAPARTLLEVFAATVARHGDRVALDAGDGRLTYAELEHAVRELAGRLAQAGIGPGDRVGVYVPSGTAELYTAILGVLHAGAAYVPVDAEDAPARAEAIFAGAGVCAVLETGLGLRERARPTEGRRALRPEDDAWIIFTSGSSGAPKGVAVSHRAASAFVEAEAALWSVTPEDRVLAGLSVGFDASCEEMWLAWRHGAALVPAPRALMRAAADLGPWLAERAITVVSTVPTLAAMWSEADLAGVRLLVLGGEACPEPLAWRLAEHREVWNTYGPTEATVVSTAARLSPGEPVAIGWPLEGWKIAIVDAEGEPVTLGGAGELVIGGAGLGRYLDSALDAERFAPLPALGWPRAYRTGDIVAETIHGLRFIGRRDEQVKLGGRRLELGEVDAHLRAVPGVRAAAAAVQRTPSGAPVLVGYVVGDVEVDHVRAVVAERLPHGVSPLIVALDALPTSPAGKVDRRALPWPPPASGRPDSPALEGTATLVASLWAQELGPFPLTPASDFFDLGGSSLSAACLVSRLRETHPALAVSDLYRHRRLGELAAHLDRLGAAPAELQGPAVTGQRRWDLVHLLGVVVLMAATMPQWLLGLLALDRLLGAGVGPQVGWGWLLGGWALVGTPLGRAAIVVLARRLLLPTLTPGRYPRHSWLMCRLWFLERLADAFRSEALAGTPFAARYARLCGHQVGAGARLATLPPVTSHLRIGAGATLEADVDAHGWWLEGRELVIGELSIGAGARIGTRVLLGPGADVGAGAEVEPGSVITGRVADGERWAGSPARRVGVAGEAWPDGPPPAVRCAGLWRALFLVGLGLQSLLGLVAGLPAVLFVLLRGGDTAGSVTARIVIDAPLLAGSYLVAYALLVALAVRGLQRLVGPGWHPDRGRAGWALWLSESLMAGARDILFSLFSSIYTRAWLRLAGIPVEPGVEVSTAVGLSRLTRLRAGSFAADDVVLVGARSRAGWLHVEPIEVGRGTFLGNGAILPGGTVLGADNVIGVQSTAPARTPAGTAWFGCPAIAFPRVPDPADPARTIAPPARLKLARATLDLVRIMLPVTVSVALGALVFDVVQAAGRHGGVLAMALFTVPALLAAGVAATLFTVAAKWLIMGRYRPGEHPLWSLFVWRDEILNSLQDQLAGTWLLELLMGTSLLSVYLRAMGARVGRDVWCDTLTITEFDMVTLGDGCVINRFATIETHLFHDRLMRIGPTELGPGCSIGPATAVLPDTRIGAGTQVGGRSVVLRGEQLPAGTRWHGAPVISA
jgi:non-ribosomal peptide synthetase-like protein